MAMRIPCYDGMDMHLDGVISQHFDSTVSKSCHELDHLGTVSYTVKTGARVVELLAI